MADGFDFGGNMLGDSIEYRGSYIFNSSYNPNLSMPDELKGALVSEFNVNGLLSGRGAAIFIDESAFVRDINVNSGQIYGDIISNWDPSNPLINTTSFAGESSDGLTSLNFKNAFMRGDINGKEFINWSMEGVNVWGGKADINSFDLKANSRLNLLLSSKVNEINAQDITLANDSTLGIEGGFIGYEFMNISSPSYNENGDALALNVGKYQANMHRVELGNALLTQL